LCLILFRDSNRSQEIITRSDIIGYFRDTGTNINIDSFMHNEYYSQREEEI
jgi:hypothetical protein